MARNCVVVIDCTDKDEFPESVEEIDVFPDTPDGRKQAEEKFAELVAETLDENEYENDEAKMSYARSFVTPGSSNYEIGSGCIVMLTIGRLYI